MAYGHDTTTDEVLRGVDLTGRLAVVTGGTSGLGEETARALASAGATVVLTARDADKGAATVAALREKVPAGDFTAGVLDLTSLAAVREFAAWFLARHDRIDLLVNNAGVMATPFARTADGFELQFGTNHLGHFLLTALLAPAIVRGAPARVVNLSSGGHVASDVLWDDPNYRTTEDTYEPWKAYGQSKTANALFARQLDTLGQAKGIRAFSLHPGKIYTPLQRHLSMGEMTAQGWINEKGEVVDPTFKTVPQGAATTVWAATSPLLVGKGACIARTATWPCATTAPNPANPACAVTPLIRERPGGCGNCRLR